jgi:hypothetical protein
MFCNHETYFSPLPPTDSMIWHKYQHILHFKNFNLLKVFKITYQYFNLENKEKALPSIQVSAILQTQYMKGRNLMEYTSIDWRILLKWILNSLGRTWIGFIWFRIGTSYHV